MTDDHVESRLRAWYRSEVGEARVPVALASNIDGIPASVDMPRWRVPRWLTRRPAIGLVAAAVALFVAVVGLRLGPSFAIVGGAASPTAAAGGSSSPSAAPTLWPKLLPSSGSIEPGRYRMPWGSRQPRLTLPAGWSAIDGGQTISRYDPDEYRPRLRLTLQLPEAFVALDACTDRTTLVEVKDGTELTTALTNLAGVERIGPTDVAFAGYPAKKFVLTLPGGCPGPEEGQGPVLMAWGPRDFWLPFGGTGTVYIVDVGTEDDLVFTTTALDASAEDIAELDVIIGSFTYP